MKPRYILFFIVIALLCIIVNQTFAIQVPSLQGRVNDYANILSAETRQELENQLQKQEDTTTNQIVLLTVSSLEGQPIEMFANEVFNTWKLGKAGKNNGVLLLVAVNDHKMRIEVGYGLEHALTDALSNRIIRNELTPHFKEERYEAGIKAGIKAIVGAVDGTYTLSAEDIEDELSTAEMLWIGIPIMLVLLIFTSIIIFLDFFAPDLKISWYLFLFILIFYLVFPPIVFGAATGFTIVALYVTFFLLSRIYFASKNGKEMIKRFQTSKFMTASASSGKSKSSGSSSSNSSSSSSFSSWTSGSSSSYSGGGGNSGGGGSSGSW